MLAAAVGGAAALCTAVSLLHWWGLDPHLDEQLHTMLTDLDLHSLSPTAVVRNALLLSLASRRNTVAS